ncbi:MAG: hypothetical protein PWQ18_706 [Clostridia bacterium]|nr:hypothetical protein [Clostridia bacterium]
MRELAEVLHDELEVVRQLLAVGREEQAALAADDLAAIQSATGRKGELARRLGELEQERLQVMEKMPGTDNLFQGFSNRTASTTMQVQHYDSSEALRAALRQAVRELQEVNETNRFLARQSLAYVQRMLALLAPEGAAPALMDRMV